MLRYQQRARATIYVSAGQAFNGGSEASDFEQRTAIILAGTFIGMIVLLTFLLLWYI